MEDITFFLKAWLLHLFTLHCLIMVVEVVEEVTVYSRGSVSSVSGVSGVSSVSREGISCGAVDTMVESSISISCRLGLPLANRVDEGPVHTRSIRGVGRVVQSRVSSVCSVSREGISCGAVDTTVESSISISCRFGLPLADGVDEGAVHTSCIGGVGGVGQSRVSCVSGEAISGRVVDTTVESSISISCRLGLPLADGVDKGVVHTGSVGIVGRVGQSKAGTHYRGVSTREVETIVEGVGISLGIRLS